MRLPFYHPSAEDSMIELSDKPLSFSKALKHVRSHGSGGIDIFIGTVRDNAAGRKVVALEFEAYGKMALLELEKIVGHAQATWPVEKVAVLHALGRLEVGGVAVVIAVSAAHRDAAFTACRYIIDTLKQTVPIWKKELFEDGEEWVSAHP
ncbi:MAG: molybdenum cofactor biosynthesis protein MoaE [Cyclobacteriaceae bacterium]|nr:molybdenum cofactor biosynthesis protein MoaE [Cyclobacteriaceae bacterium]